MLIRIERSLRVVFCLGVGKDGGIVNRNGVVGREVRFFMEVVGEGYVYG